VPSFLQRWFAFPTLFLLITGGIVGVVALVHMLGRVSRTPMDRLPAEATVVLLDETVRELPSSWRARLQTEAALPITGTGTITAILKQPSGSLAWIQFSNPKPGEDAPPPRSSVTDIETLFALQGPRLRDDAALRRFADRPRDASWVFLRPSFAVQLFAPLRLPEELTGIELDATEEIVRIALAHKQTPGSPDLPRSIAGGSPNAAFLGVCRDLPTVAQTLAAMMTPETVDLVTALVNGQLTRRFGSGTLLTQMQPFLGSWTAVTLTPATETGGALHFLLESDARPEIWTAALGQLHGRFRETFGGYRVERTVFGSGFTSVDVRVADTETTEHPERGWMVRTTPGADSGSTLMTADHPGQLLIADGADLARAAIHAPSPIALPLPRHMPNHRDRTVCAAAIAPLWLQSLQSLFPGALPWHLMPAEENRRLSIGVTDGRGVMSIWLER
jgi:hypothetical protein